MKPPVGWLGALHFWQNTRLQRIFWLFIHSVGVFGGNHLFDKAFSQLLASMRYPFA